MNRLGRETKSTGALPPAAQDNLSVSEQAAAQGQNQGNGVFGHGIDRVAADIGHRNPKIPASFQIDHIIAGCRHGDEFQLGQLCQDRLTQRHLVGDDNIRVNQPFMDLFGCGRVVSDPLMSRRGAMKLRSEGDCRAIEKNDTGLMGAS